MTGRKQAHSLVNIQEEETDASFSCYRAVKEARADARDNLQIVSSLSDSINTLCANLDRLDAFIETMIIGNGNKEKGK